MPRAASTSAEARTCAGSALPAQRQDRVVLQQQQRVGRSARGARRDQLVLPVPGVLVPDPAQPFASQLHGRTIAGGAARPWRTCGTRIAGARRRLRLRGRTSMGG